MFLSRHTTVMQPRQTKKTHYDNYFEPHHLPLEKRWIRKVQDREHILQEKADSAFLLYIFHYKLGQFT